MEEDYTYRLNSQLLIFEKNSKEWEWSDLIKWLSGLKQIIEKYSIPVPADLIQILSKRLGQCLSPSLPHGLHSKAFEIYNILLQTPSYFQISVLSTGLFPHFQFCAPQNKPQFLELIKARYIDRFNEVRFMIKGLISSLLEGANETPDTFVKVSEILEICEKNNKKLTFEVVWWFILKSPKHRLAGLQYMQKKQDKFTSPDLIECALLESLNDDSVINRRNALDYIRLNYPVDAPFPGLINLVQGTLHLLKAKDHTVIRRIWEWIYPNEFDEKQVETIEKIIRPALLNLLKANHFKIVEEERADEVKIESIKIIENLCEHENIGEIILKIMVLDIVRYTITDQLFLVHGKKDTRIANVICSKGAEFFWSAYAEKLEVIFMHKQDIDLEIFRFGVQQFGNEKIPVKIIKKHITSLNEVSEIEPALDLLIPLVKNINIEEVEIDPILSLLELHIKGKEISIISKIAKLIRKLPNYELKIVPITNLVKTTISSDFEIGVILSIRFNNTLKHELILEMWNKLDTSKTENSLLLYKAFKSKKIEWNLATLNFLLNKQNNLIESPSRKFIIFWDCLNKENKKNLHNLCRHSKIMYTFIEKLSSDDPVSRLMAREWLETAIVCMENIFDQILTILLKEFMTCDLTSDGFYQYQQNCDLDLVEKILKMTVSVISVGSRSLLKKMYQDRLSDYCISESKKYNFTKNNYLSLLIQLLFMYIQTSTAPQRIESPSIHSPILAATNIQDVSSDLLILIIKNINKKICTVLLHKTSEVLFKMINDQTKLDFYLLRIIQQMFSFNKPTFSCPSVFSECLFLGLKKDSKKIRRIWVKILIQILPIIITSVKADDLANYLQKVFESYFDSIFKFKDFSLLYGLTKLMNVCLNVSASGISVVFSETTKKVIKSQTGKVVETIFSYFFENNRDLSLINDLIFSVKSVFLGRLVKSIYKLWKSFVFPALLGKELEISIKMIPNFQLSVDEILETMIKYMEKHKNFSEDVYCCNFCQNVLMYLENYKIPIPKLQIWKRTLNLIRRLLVNEHREAYIIAINILHTVATKVSIEEKLSKEIQEISRILLVDNFFATLSAREKARSTVYYSTETVHEMVSKNYLKTVHQRGYYIIEIIWNTNQEKEKNNFQISFINTLISSLCQVTEGGDIISDLIQHFLKNPTNSICEGVKKPLMEFMKANLLVFLNKHPTAFRSWKAIINKAALSFYSDKTALLLELMYEYEPGILGSFWSSNSLTKNLYHSASLMCLIVFSSSKGVYSKLLQGITDKIKEIQKHEENFDLQKVLMLICKVLYLKLNPSDFSKIWRLVWPNTHIYIAKHLEHIKISHTFEVLKLVDFILTTNFTENLVFSNFFIDVPEFQIVQEAQSDFQPICMKFLKGFTAKLARYGNERVFLTSMKEKKMILSGKKPETGEDIENFGKSIIQYASCYSSECLETDWSSVETEIEKEIIALGSC